MIGLDKADTKSEITRVRRRCVERDGGGAARGRIDNRVSVVAPYGRDVVEPGSQEGGAAAANRCQAISYTPAH